MIKQMVQNDNNARRAAGKKPLKCDDSAGAIAYKWSEGQCECASIS